MAVTTQEVVGTWTDQQGRWLVLTANGNSYMDSALGTGKHIPVPAASKLAPYFSGHWTLDNAASTEAVIAYPDNRAVGPMPPAGFGTLDWCTSGSSRLQLVYDSDLDAPCAGMTFTRANKGITSRGAA